MITCLPFPATDPHPRIHVRMKKHTKVQTIIEIRNYHRQTPIISTRRNTETKLPSPSPSLKIPLREHPQHPLQPQKASSRPPIAMTGDLEEGQKNDRLAISRTTSRSLGGYAAALIVPRRAVLQA